MGYAAVGIGYQIEISAAVLWGVGYELHALAGGDLLILHPAPILLDPQLDGGIAGARAAISDEAVRVVVPHSTHNHIPRLAAVEMEGYGIGERRLRLCRRLFCLIHPGLLGPDGACLRRCLDG